MKTVLEPLQEEQGSILILCILMLFILTILGISSTNTSDLELSIASNENFFHMAFYQADGGAETGKEVVEQAIEERIWLDTTTPPVMIDTVKVLDVDFYKNPELTDSDIPSGAATDTDVSVSLDVEGRTFTTNIVFGSDTDFATGAALQMASGYEGLGKGSAGGGAWIDYGIRARHEGIKNTDSRVRAGWKHVI